MVGGVGHASVIGAARGCVPAPVMKKPGETLFLSPAGPYNRSDEAIGGDVRGLAAGNGRSQKPMG
jgi:hypothetical protein